MATYQTYQMVGIKEDISDVIVNISPRKTPFQTRIGTQKVWNTLYQWQEDSLRAVATNSLVEGADVSFITANPTVMRTNYTQILTESVQVAGTAESVQSHGRAKEMAYQLAKSGAQVKRDLENALVGNAQSAAAGNSSTARTFASVQQLVGGANVSYMGAATPLSEAGLVSALQTAYIAGADPTFIHVTPSNSVVIAGFASAAGRYRTIPTELNGRGATSTIVNTINLYVSPFGEQRIEINRFQKAKNTIIFEPDMWKLATLRPWTREGLAKTGDSIKNMIVGEFGLIHKNFLASAIVVDNATSGF